MMQMFEKIGLKALRKIDPETAHGLAMTALKSGLTARPGPVTSDRLQTTVAGLELPNPVGLAAGFDKNAETIGPLSAAGFGFIEVGAATPIAQPGNPKPRLFRLTEDQAAINRFGFNNEGAEAIAARLSARSKGIPVGINLGANKTSTNKAVDFAEVLKLCGPHVDFATVNVSSPNTEKLRDLQGPMALAMLLDGVMQVRGDCPVFLKIAPDLSDQDLADIAKVASDARVAAIITTNTTLDRDDLRSKHKGEAGGLSGKPLFEKSTRVLAKLGQWTDIPLIGVGGISSAEDAYTKVKAGASAVQLYTALVYGGLSLAAQIARDLDALLAKDGFENIAEAKGIEAKNWL
jgi:dihydroorotate dehydrogenase